MLLYQDIITGDELLSDSFPHTEIENGALWEVEGKWVVKGAPEVNIAANPPFQGGEEEAVEDKAIKVIDIVDTFLLQELKDFDKDGLVNYMKRCVMTLPKKIEELEKQDECKRKIEGASEYLLSKINELKFFAGESMHEDGTVVFAYYKEGSTDPTFLYIPYALRGVKT